MGSIKTFVIIAIIGFICAAIFVTFKKREKKERDKLYELTKSRLEKLNTTLISSAEALQRTEQISKSDDTIKHYNKWKTEFNDIETEINDLRSDYLDVEKIYEKGKHNDYLAANETLGFRFDTMEEKLGLLHTRLYNFTSYELENTEIALDLKTQLKELESDFERVLSVREIYTESFEKECSIVENELRLFEDNQKLGDYTKARKYLKNATDLINNISYNYDVITNMINYIGVLDNNIKIIDEVSERISEKKFRLDQDEYLQNYDQLKVEKTTIEDEINELRINIEISDEFVRNHELQLENLQTAIFNIKNSIEQQYSQIKVIDSHISSNKEYLDQCDLLVNGAIEERDEINRLYEMPSSRPIQKLETEIERYEKFKEDYYILLDIVYSLNEDYATLVERVTQSHEYIKHFITNVKQSLDQLKEIRIDEINALESIDTFKREITQIEFYITAQEHYYQMSTNLADSLNDGLNKIEQLDQYLNTAPLNITEVRKLKRSSETIIADLKVAAEKEIADKELANLLIRFISRFVDSKDAENVMQHCRTIYSKHDYKRVNTEGVNFLKSKFQNHEALFEQIKTQVDYQTFNQYCGIE